MFEQSKYHTIPRPDIDERPDRSHRTSGWLKGEMLELAIIRTLQRFGRPMDWPEIVSKAPLDHISTYQDRNTALASLVSRGAVVVDQVPKPHSMWDRIDIYYLPKSKTADGGARDGNR